MSESRCLDTAAVMAEHFGVAGVDEQADCAWCYACGSDYPCEGYRLAEALAAERAKVAQVYQWCDGEMQRNGSTIALEGVLKALHSLEGGATEDA